MKKILTLGVFAMAFGLAAGCKQYHAKVRVVNGTTIVAVSVSVTVDGASKTAKGLRPGSSLEWNFEVKRDADYLVEVIYVDGKTTKGNVGYLTRGQDFEDEILLREKNIEISARK